MSIGSIKSTKAVQIAFASSEPDPTCNPSITPRPARWTELAVYFDPEPKIAGKRWIAMTRGVSTYPGERIREEVIQVGTLKRALKLFDPETNLGRSVIAQAEDWAENRWIDHAPAVFTPGGGGPYEFDTQDAALRWLYGDELDQAKAQTLIARDFGAVESTVRAAIAAGRPIKVPLVAALRFIDRKRFSEARRDG